VETQKGMKQIELADLSGKVRISIHLQGAFFTGLV
jgi:hypothetical protein